MSIVSARGAAIHDAITLRVPVTAIFFGILLNQRGLGELKSDLKGEMSTLKSDLKGDIQRVESKIDRLQADLKEFSRELGRHDARPRQSRKQAGLA